MTRTASISKDQLYRGNRPQSKSWLKKWLFRAAIVGTLVLGEHILKTSVHSDGWVNTVGGQAQAQVKKVDKAELAKTALKQLEEARKDPQRDKRPGGALFRPRPARDAFLETLSKLGLVDTDPDKRFKSLVNTYGIHGQTNRRSYLEAENKIERELKFIISHQAVSEAVKEKLRSQPTKTPLVAERSTLQATPKVTPVKKQFEPEPVATPQEIKAGLEKSRSILLRRLDQIEATVARSKYGKMEVEVPGKRGKIVKKLVDVKAAVKKYIDEQRTKVKAANNPNDFGTLIRSTDLDDVMISLAAQLRNIIEKKYKGHEAYRSSVVGLNGAIVNNLISKTIPRDGDDAAYAITDAFAELVTPDKKHSPISNPRGSRWWITEGFSDISFMPKTEVTPKGKMDLAVKAAETVFARLKKNGINLERMKYAQDLVKEAKAGKVTDPERHFERLWYAVTGPLAFAEANELAKEGSRDLWRKDISDAAVTNRRQSLLNAVKEAEKIFDQEFRSGITSTLIPSTSVDMVIEAMNNLEPRASTVFENGYFRRMRNQKARGERVKIEDIEQNALTALSMSKELAKPWDKVARGVGLESARTLVQELVAAGVKSTPIQRAYTDTTVSDSEQNEGGWLESQQTTLKDRDSERAKKWKYTFFTQPKVWERAESQKTKAAKGHLKSRFGPSLDTMLGKKRKISDLSDDEIGELAKQLKPAYQDITRNGNLGFYQLITDYRKALKQKFKIGEKEDFVKALTSRRNQPEVSDTAKKYYDRAIDYLGRVDKLLGVMSKNMDKDLFNGSVPAMYANPHRTFELLIGVEVRKEEPPKRKLLFEFEDVRVERLGFTGRYSYITGDNLRAVTSDGKVLSLDEYSKLTQKKTTTQNFSYRFAVFVDLPSGTYLLNPAFITTSDAVRDALEKRNNEKGAMFVQKWLGKVVDGVVYKTVRGDPDREMEIETVEGNKQKYFDLDKEKLKEGRYVPVRNDVYKKVVESEVTKPSNETRIDGVPYPERAVHGAAYPTEFILRTK